MQVSSYQQAILEAVSNSEKNIIISGVAGCGKSTTLKLIAKQIKKQNPCRSILYLAFNNEICSDIAPKLEPMGVDVSTFHKWGNRAIQGKKKIEAYKYRNYISQFVNRYIENNDSLPFDFLNAKQINQVVDILRIWYRAIDETSVLEALEHWNIDVSNDWIDDNLINFTEYVKEVINWGMNQKSEIDFVDMLVFPVRHRMPLKKYDVYLIDECQDLSNIMLHMIKSVSKYARFIAVGDSFQAINGFAGADLHSFHRVKELLNADELPLSVCYRCPDPVIELAQKYVSTIQGTGMTGIVENKNIFQFLETVKPTDLIICRRNAPLVSLAFKLMTNGYRVIIKGRQFADHILYYVKKIERQKVPFNFFLTSLEEMIYDLVSKTKNKEKIETLFDIKDCIAQLVENSDVQSYKQLIELIDRLFDENTKDNSVVLCSFHRSKGLQNETVWILLDKPLSSPNNGQESNLAYVAITRAMNNLYFVPYDSESKKEVKKSEE